MAHGWSLLNLVQVARAGNIRSGSGDHQHQRLRSCAHARLHGVKQIAGFVFVVLIDDRTAGRCAVTGLADAGSDFELFSAIDRLLTLMVMP